MMGTLSLRRFIGGVALCLAAGVATKAEGAQADEVPGNHVFSRTSRDCCAVTVGDENEDVFLGDVAYGDLSERQRLDILRPIEVDHRRPAIIFLHGGGWYTGGKGGPNTLKMMQSLVDAGYVAVSMDYRLADEAPFPAAVHDCKQAVRWLRAHAEHYGVDPKRIGVMGSSAGGHLASMLAVTTPTDGLEGETGSLGELSSVQVAVAVCAPFDLRVPLSSRLAGEDDPAVLRFLGGPISAKQDAARRASPITHVRKDSQPLLIVHGTGDKRVDLAQAEAMIRALEAAGAPHETILVEGGKHGMGIARRPEVSDRIMAFFGAHLRPAE